MAKKKTARAEMTWIDDRKRWRKRVIIDGKSRDVYGKTQDEVREKIKEMERLVEAGMVLDDNTTLVHFAREWFPTKASKIREKSAEVYRNAINNHIAPYFGDMKLSDIRPLHVEKFMVSRSDLSKSSQTKILYTLSQIMENAAKNGLILRNPCSGVKAGGEEAKKKSPLSDDQQDEILNAATGTRAELFVMLCLYAGLRREEALGLLWSDVVLGHVPYIHVRHTVTFPDNAQGVFSDKVKSKAANRKIPIPFALSHLLTEKKGKANSVFVIPAVKTGGAMSYTAYTRMWEIATKNLSFPCSPHILRHTYLTELCASGLDIKKIQYLAGHEDVNVTLRIYTHVKNNQPEDMIEDIIRIFSGSSPGSEGKEASQKA